MRNILSYITVFTSTLNAIVAFFFAFKLFTSKERSYLNDQFKHFFIYFSLYFVLINILVTTFIDKPYLFFVFLEIFHFVLALGLAYLFSAFIYLRHQRTTKTAFWIFVLIGFTISLFGIVSVNPNVTSSLDIFSAYVYPGTLYIPKIIYLGIGFLYPAFSFLHQAIIAKDSFVKKRYYLLASAFMAWLVGGAMHSRFDEPLFSIVGDSILLVGFIFAGIILLETPKKNKK